MHVSRTFSGMLNRSGLAEWEEYGHKVLRKRWTMYDPRGTDGDHLGDAAADEG